MAVQGLRFYLHCVFEQVMGITTGVNNTFHASRFSGKLYFIGAELRFVRSARALPRARPVGGFEPPTLSSGRRDTDGSLRLNSPGEKRAADFPPCIFSERFFHFNVKWKRTTVHKQVNGRPEEYIRVYFEQKKRTEARETSRDTIVPNGGEGERALARRCLNTMNQYNLCYSPDAGPADTSWMYPFWGEDPGMWRSSVIRVDEREPVGHPSLHSRTHKAQSVHRFSRSL